MSLKNDVLTMLQLKNGEYISGQELAEKSGKSRAAVWKAVKALQKDGYVINAVTNKGYSLTSEGDILSGAKIKNTMKHDISVIHYTETDSTNTQAKRLLSSGEANGTLLVTAEKQTAGRGRQGKTFYSPPHTGIYMSLIVHPNTMLQNAVTATTAAAVAVCRAIERLTDIRPQIKWVNDVYVNDKKICGILTEAVSDFELGIVTSVIVGIGINIKTNDFPDEVERAGSLNADIKRADLIGTVADELLDIIGGNCSDFIDYYRSHSMIIGKQINYIENGVVTPATALSIDEAGGLVVKTENGTEKTLKSGEISIRWQE
ncbi:MAG: biotin--[acetyl-CoA-carboxylase] ligase [Eubacterium sp.]|nr:biotin--[acetyl-CoA-carboxylase] ligase [Eubacterium sp.]